MKHSRLKGYKTIFYIVIIFAIVLLSVWRFGMQRINFISNPLTKETSGYLLEMLGLTFILFSVCMKFLIKRDNGLFYLGILSVLLGCWIYLRSGTVHVPQQQMILIELLKATLLALAPFSVALYFNEFQNQRYLRIYQPVMIVSSVNWIVCMIALYASARARTTVYMSIQMVIILTLGICIYTMVVDAVRRLNRYSVFIACGLMVCTVASIVEIVFTYNHQYQWIDEIYGYGMLVAFVSIGLLTIYKQTQEQKQYERALVEDERNFLVKKLNQEIQRPMQKIIRFSEQIMDECQDEETYQTAGEIQYEGNIILKLVENVMACVQLENGSIDIKNHNIDSVRYMNEIINRCFQQVERKGLELVINIAEDFPRAVYGGGNCVTKICNIFLDNAIRYTVEGTITLSVGWLPVENNEIKVFITVEDTGKGFEEEHLLKIKELFQNPELTQNRIYLEGVGYGLIAAIGLSKEINGTLRVKSERDKGTSMSLSFSQVVIDQTPIGEFQNWYDTRKKTIRKLKKKEEIWNEIKEEVRKEMENEQKETQEESQKVLMKDDEDVDNKDNNLIQNAVLQLEKESIHIRNAMKYVADDFEQYVCLMKLFVQTTDEKQNALKEMLEQKQYADYTVKTHALKNNARTLGADDLADMAFAHEKASDQNDIAYVTTHFSALLEEWKRIQYVFQTYLSENGQLSETGKKEETTEMAMSDMPNSQLTEKLRQMINYIDTFKKKEALETVKELLQYDLKHSIECGLLEVQETIQKYDYAKALTILEGLVGGEEET